MLGYRIAIVKRRQFILTLIMALSYHLIFIVASSEVVFEHCRVKTVSNNQLRLWPIHSIAADVQLYIQLPNKSLHNNVYNNNE